MALAFPGQSGSLWEVMARDAFLESLGDPALRLRVLERDPEILEKALKLATRLEALGYVEVDDNWDDAGRRKDKFAKVSTAEESSELTTLMRELKSELKQGRKERESLQKTGDGRRSGSELVVGMTDESVRPTRYPDQPIGGYGVGEWQAPPLAPPPGPPRLMEPRHKPRHICRRRRCQESTAI